MRGDFQTATAPAAQATAQSDARAATRAQSTQEIRDRVQEQVRAELQRAQEQVQAAQSRIEAARVQRVRVGEPVPVVVPTPPVPPVAPGQGEYIEVAGGFGNPNDIPPRAQEVTMMFFATVALVIIGLPIARAIGRWIDRRSSMPAVKSADVEPHLVRIEQAVEAMAIEIERISEAQRYLTKLQTASRGDPLLVPRQND